MSLIHEQNIEAFIYLIKNHTSLFLPEYRADLEQQIVTFSENTEQLSDTISSWCRNHIEIRQALSQIRRTLFGNNSKNDRGPASFIPAAKPKDYKTLLKNQIRESFSELPSKQSDKRE